jgi:L-ascorbate metabolism protein UlaG (beta-lactamase superfamily)
VPAERIVELGWWERAAVPGTDLVVTATPAQHFSGRGAFDRNRTLWAGWALSGPRHRVFFSGDTGLEPSFAEIGRRAGPFDLVMLEVGAYHPAWGTIHLGPEQALRALEALGSPSFLPVHWGTFDLALHAWDEPILALEQAAREGDLALLAPLLGEVRDVLDRDDVRRAALRPWWRDVVPG